MGMIDVVYEINSKWLHNNYHTVHLRTYNLSYLQKLYKEIHQLYDCHYHDLLRECIDDDEQNSKSYTADHLNDSEHVTLSKETWIMCCTDSGHLSPIDNRVKWGHNSVLSD